ncbi:ATP synthase F1, beta subunit, partial [Vibrio parahaemolyticus VP2007-007]
MATGKIVQIIGAVV